MNIFKIIIFLLFNYSIKSQSQNAINFINQIEQELNKRVAFLESAYHSRCNITDCKKSYIACSDKVPDFQCSILFNNSQCTSCYSIAGSQVSFTESIVSISDLTKYREQEFNEMSCATKDLDEIFIETKNRFAQIKWQYVGFYNSFYRKYPAALLCNYDPRSRPWYSAAISGSKNVVLMIDISNSMNPNLKNVKDAAKIILQESMNSIDWVGVILFNSAAVSLTPTLVRAEISTRNDLYNKLDPVDTSGVGNYEEAFKAAYNLLADTKKNGMLSSCQTVLLLLSDGNSSKNENDNKNLIKFIDDLETQNKIDAIIMTYGFGPNAKIENLLPISCSRNGKTELIDDALSIKEKMVGYYSFLASGFTRNEVIWIEPYFDFSGLGLMTSAIIPFYDKINFDPPRLIGVTAMDITMAEFYKFDSSDVILNKLLSNSLRCNKFKLSFCQLEDLRGQLKCSKNIQCPVSKNIMPKCGKFNLKGFYDDWDVLTTVNVCCGLYLCKEGLVGIIVPILSILLIIIVSIIYRDRICRKSKKIENNDVYKHDNNVENSIYFGQINPIIENSENSAHKGAMSAPELL
jgi:hypothetical protein